MHFKKLTLHNWKFRSIDVDFHHRLTILTGANGAGKTTLLNLLGRHFRWEIRILGVPVIRERNSRIRDRVLG